MFVSLDKRLQPCVEIYFFSFPEREQKGMY